MAGGSPPQRFSVTPAGPPEVDLDSDIIQKWLHIPRGEGLRPRRPPPHPIRCQSHVQVVVWASD